MPAGIYTKRVEGTRLEIWIPSLSILVARAERPVLIRRGDDTPQVGQFDLHAVYSFLNEALFRDDDFKKEWTFYLGKRPIKLSFPDGSKTDLTTEARSIRCEGVEWHDPSQSTT